MESPSQPPTAKSVDAWSEAGHNVAKHTLRGRFPVPQLRPPPAPRSPRVGPARRAPAVRGLLCRVRRLVAARRPLRWAMLLPVHGPRRAAVCPPRAPQPRFLRCHTVGAEDPKRLRVCPRRVTGWDEILTPCRRRWAWVPKSKSQDIFRTLPPSSRNKRMADRSLENSESACPCLSPSRSLSQALRLFPKAKRRRMNTEVSASQSRAASVGLGGKVTTKHTHSQCVLAETVCIRLGYPMTMAWSAASSRGAQLGSRTSRDGPAAINRREV